jgi:hypothetical protein
VAFALAMGAAAVGDATALTEILVGGVGVLEVFVGRLNAADGSALFVNAFLAVIGVGKELDGLPGSTEASGRVGKRPGQLPEFVEALGLAIEVETQMEVTRRPNSVNLTNPIFPRMGGPRRPPV